MKEIDISTYDRVGFGPELNGEVRERVDVLLLSTFGQSQYLPDKDIDFLLIEAEEQAAEDQIGFYDNTDWGDGRVDSMQVNPDNVARLETLVDLEIWKYAEMKGENHDRYMPERNTSTVSESKNFSVELERTKFPVIYSEDHFDIIKQAFYKVRKTRNPSAPERTRIRTAYSLSPRDYVYRNTR